MTNKEIKKWITVKGKHVPIYEPGVALDNKYEDDEHKPTAIADVKKGDFFKLSNKPNAKVYVRDEYDRSEKAYWCYDFYDVNDGRYIKKNKTVYTGFTF